MIVFRHADPRWPFLWESAGQPPGRWHGAGDGPAHYFADTPDGAWAELLRHEEITDPEDLPTLRRSLWAVDVPDDEPAGEPRLDEETLTGGLDSYGACQAEALRLRATGARRIDAPSAALADGAAHGYRVDGGLRPGPRRDGCVIVLFGPRPDLVGWAAAAVGRPREELLEAVRPLT